MIAQDVHLPSWWRSTLAPISPATMRTVVAGNTGRVEVRDSER